MGQICCPQVQYSAELATAAMSSALSAVPSQLHIHALVTCYLLVQPHTRACVCAGDRIQLHRNGNDIQYYSRRGVEHGEYSGFTVMDAVVKKQLKHEKCILDGEMIVWNKTRSV